ncbi:hypothetical protein NDU88_002286 [Pleurodeles waltl]|uniref:Uncharacterized protein n=1 Tax=Pleurodeles waltl TaxID=8319 RepID=A0AAV7VD50_PLEWA|nr:hypothetical protein NDU88_002286 [Pleurodeles waltl]
MMRICLLSGDPSRKQERQDIRRKRTERRDPSSQPLNREMQLGQRPQRKQRDGQRGWSQRKNPLRLHIQETEKRDQGPRDQKGRTTLSSPPPPPAADEHARCYSRQCLETASSLLISYRLPLHIEA